MHLGEALRLQETEWAPESKHFKNVSPFSLFVTVHK